MRCAHVSTSLGAGTPCLSSGLLGQLLSRTSHISSTSGGLLLLVSRLPGSRQTGSEMAPELVAAVARAAAGEKINVSHVCRGGVTRSVFYLKLARFKEQGSAGCAAVGAALADEHVGAVRRRRAARSSRSLADQVGPRRGVDPLRLLDHARSGVHPAGGRCSSRRGPVAATIHRILSSAARSPRRRASALTGAPLRAPRPQRGLQIDGTTTLLADSTRVTVVQIIDDHSRLDIACHAATSENSDAVWQALTAGFERYGTRPACSPTTAPPSPAPPPVAPGRDGTRPGPAGITTIVPRSASPDLREERTQATRPCSVGSPPEQPRAR